MTITRIPLPADPLPTMTPCAGLWDLFDSGRLGDHLKAKKICGHCHLVEECKPPGKIYTPGYSAVSNDTRITASEPNTTGTWGGRLYRKGEEIPEPPSGPIACPTCGARTTERCRTSSGESRLPHKHRSGPVMCPCGAAEVVPKRQRCAACVAGEKAA